MLRCIPFFLAVATAVAANPPTAADRAAAFERLSKDALVERLLEQSAADIQSHHYQAALDKATQAEKIRPADPGILNTKGAALVELRRFDEAAKALDAAVAADPKAFAPQFNQGEMLSLQKKYADAALQFALLQSRFGPLPRIKYNVYLMNALAGRKEDAIAALLLMRYPEDGIAWYYAQAADCLLAGKPAEAKKLLATAAAIHREEVSAYRDTLVNAGLLK
jgi:Flp pilus assembly protein TadD